MSPLIPTVVGWMLGLASALVVEKNRLDRQQQMTSRMILAEVESIWQWLVELDCYLGLLHLGGYNRVPPRTQMQSRSLYRAYLPQLSFLPTDCLRDVLSFYEAMSELETMWGRLMADVQSYSTIEVKPRRHLRHTIPLARRAVLSLNAVQDPSVSEEWVISRERQIQEDYLKRSSSGE